MIERDYIPRQAKIIERTELDSATVAFKLKLAGPDFHFVPGQFVMISALGFGEVPIGISSSPRDHKHLEIAVRNTGTVTDKLTKLSVGDSVGVSGPFGNGLPLSKIKGKNVVLVAGGLGLPPLRSFIKHIEENPKFVKSLTIINGARTPNSLMYDSEYANWEKFARVELTVDNCGPDWKGCVGLVTKLFDKAEVKKGSVMLVCGPPIMFKSVIDRFAGKRVAEDDLYLFLERKMHCGVGKCQHCTCGKEYVCLDGPVFPYSSLKYNSEAFK